MGKYGLKAGIKRTYIDAVLSKLDSGGFMGKKKKKTATRRSQLLFGYMQENDISNGSKHPTEDTHQTAHHTLTGIQVLVSWLTMEVKNEFSSQNCKQ